VTSAFGSFLESAVRTSTPLLLAALGEVVVERAGIINIGLEGVVIAGAFGALVGSAHGVAAGFLLSLIVGALLSLAFYICIDPLGADQIVTGTAISILGLGGTGALYQAWFGSQGAALSVRTIDHIAIPWLSRLPLVGQAFFDQPVTTYLCYVLVPLTWWWMFRTHAGLALRSIGEAPEAALVSGIDIRRYRIGAVLFGGALGGLAGGTLVLAQVGTFAEGMSAGRGFIAIAVVVLGRWNPAGIAIAALVFGAATALQFWIQALGLEIPYQVVLALPYILTLAGLAGLGGRVNAPAWLGRQLGILNS
jgi:simple sugar transport system permease protein